MSPLLARHCTALSGPAHRLGVADLPPLLAQLPGWEVSEDIGSISKAFKFADYLLTIKFVNAIAAMAEAENHHPDLEVSYGRCVVRYNTHDVDGLSINDFICAAKADALFAG